MVAKAYAGAAAATVLAADLPSTTDDFISVTDATGYPSSADPFVIVIGRGTSKEEKVLIASVSGTQFTIASSGRGYDGTQAQSHDAGETVEHCIDALTIQEANDHTNDTSRDDHTQYLNTARHTTAHTAWTFPTAPTPSDIATAAATGSNAAPAHGDHVHKIGTGAINSSGMFAAGVVDAAALGTDAVTNAKIGTGAVDTAELAAGAVTTAKIGAAAVTATELATSVAGAGLAGGGGTALSVNTDGTTVEITTDTVNVVAGGISTSQLADGSVTAAKHNASDPIPHSASATLIPSAANNTNSTSYIDYPGAGVGGPARVTGFVKSLDATAVLVTVDISRIFTVTSTVTATLAIHDGTSAHKLFSFKPGTGVEKAQSRTVRITGLTAGTYSFTLQAKVSSAGGAVQVDDDSDLTVTVVESY